MKTNFLKSAVVGGLLLAVLPMSYAAQADASNPPPAAPGVTSPAIAPGLAFSTKEVLKMYQGGINKDIILSYVEASGSPFRLTADGIIYLHGIGLPQDVISAMIHRDGDLQRMAATAPQQAVLPAQAPDMTAYAGAAAAQPPVVVPSSPPPSVTYVQTPEPYYYPYDYGYDYGYPYYGGGFVIGAPLFWGFHGGFHGGVGGFHGGVGGFHGGIGGFHGGGFGGRR